MTNKYRILFESKFKLTDYQMKDIRDKLRTCLSMDYGINLDNIEIEFLWQK